MGWIIAIGVWLSVALACGLIAGAAIRRMGPPADDAEPHASDMAAPDLAAAEPEHPRTREAAGAGSE